MTMKRSTYGSEAARQAIERARAAKQMAEAHLQQSTETTADMRHEIEVNHLAQDIYDAMRRRRP